jgi:DNA-binding CsgD family transcriptional regulator
MSFVLTSADAARLGATLTALLSPLAYSKAEDWRREVLAQCQTLLGADQAFFILMQPGEVAVQTTDARTQDALDAYAAYYWQVDPGVTERRKRLGLEVYTRGMVYDESHLGRTEIFADWALPHRLLDPLVACADDAGVPGAFADAPIPPTLAFYKEREDGLRFGERGIGLLELLLPAFKASVGTAVRLGEARGRLAAVVDGLAEGVALCDVTGRVLHRNPSLTRSLAEEPESGLLEAEIRRAAVVAARSTLPRRSGTKTAGAFGGRARRSGLTEAGGQTGAIAPVGEVATPSARYRVRATHVGEMLFGGGAVVTVLVERLVHPRSEAARRRKVTVLTTQYRLTPREATVALLLADGKANTGIAVALGVTPYTARRHTERVLKKLNVHSRSAVASVVGHL